MATTSQIYLAVEDEFSCAGELEVTQLAPNRFRLEMTPFMMFDGGLHDIIEADLQDDGSYKFRGIVERSTWQRFDFILTEELSRSDAFKDRLFATVKQLGGTWESFGGGCIFLYLPQGCQFDLQKQIAAIREELRSDQTR